MGQLNTGFTVVITGNYVKRIKAELPKTTSNLPNTIAFKEIHQQAFHQTDYELNNTTNNKTQESTFIAIVQA